MDIIGIIFLSISTAFITGLIIFLLMKTPKTKLLWLLIIHLLCTEMWLIGTLQMFLHADDIAAVIFWDRFVYIGVTMLPAILFHFTVTFVKQVQKYKKILYGFYGFSFIFLALSWLPIFIDGVFIYGWGVHTKAQIAHHFFLAFFFIAVIWAFYLLFQYYKNLTDPLEKERTKYIFLSFVSLYGISSFAFLPAYNISIYPIPFISVVFMFGFLAYAITRYKLLSLHIVIKRGLIFLVGYFIALVLLFAALFIGIQLDISTLLAMVVLTALVVVLLIQPVHTVIRNRFWKEEYDLAFKVNQNEALNVFLAEYVLPALRSFEQEVKINSYALYVVDPDTFTSEVVEYIKELPINDMNDRMNLKAEAVVYLRNCTGIIEQGELSQFIELRNVLKKKKMNSFVVFSNTEHLYGVLLLDIPQRSAAVDALILKHQDNINSILYMALNLYYVQRRTG